MTEMMMRDAKLNQIIEVKYYFIGLAARHTLK